MDESLDIRIEEEGGHVKILGESRKSVDRELRDAIDDIADRIEEYAKTLAPEGETGELKAHPTDRTTHVLGVATDIPLFGGGFSIRGAGGRFVKGGVSELTPGREIAHIEITVATNPPHAIWVHQGTGIFGPHNSPIVPRHASHLVFTIGDRKFRRKFVLGQKPQPYLTQAYEFVNRTYVPKRVEQLREQLDKFF